MRPTLGAQMTSGIGWMLANQAASRLFDVVGLAIFARLLLPADFGLFAMAVLVGTIVDMLVSFDFDLGLIQKSDARTRHWNAAFTLTLLQRLGAGALTAAVAGPVAMALEMPRLEPLLYAVAVGSALLGLQNIGVVDFRRRLEIRREFWFQVGGKALGFAATLGFALLWADAWALVAGLLVYRATSVVLSYAMHGFRPRLRLGAAAELLHFSKWLFVKNVLSYLNHKLDDLVVARVAGATVVGQYSVSYDIATMGSTELVFPISRVAFPGYARLSHDRSVLRRYFLNVVSSVAILTLPIGAGTVVLAEPLIAVLLGEPWRPAAPLLRVFGLAGMIHGVAANAGPVYLAVGKPQIGAAFATGRVLLLAGPLVWSAMTFGAIGAAWAQLACNAIFAPITYVTVAHLLDLRLREAIAALLRPVLATAAMAAVLSSFSGSVATAAGLAFAVAGGAVVYAGALAGLWMLAGRPASAEREILLFAAARLGRQGSARGSP